MSDFKLIVTICNHGYAEEIMDSAKSAGARGGTVLRGRSTAIYEETKFFGITLHPEKDVILIVSKAESGNKIMSAITADHGAGKKAHALCFSVPIDETLGFNF